MHIAVKRYQKADIQHHLESAGKKGSAWKAVGVGFASLAILVVYTISLSFTVFTPNIVELPQFKSAIVEAEYSRCKVYFDSTTVTEPDAKVVGVILESVGYFSPNSPGQEALFYREKGTYIIAIAVPELALTDHSVDDILQKALAGLHQAYSARKYRFRLLAIDKDEITGESYVPTE